MIKTLKLNEKAKDIFKQTNASYVFDSNWSPITTKLVHEAVSGSNLSYWTVINVDFRKLETNFRTLESYESSVFRKTSKYRGKIY